MSAITRSLFVILIWLGLGCCHISTGLLTENVCVGTQLSLSLPGDRHLHYASLRERYTNCTYVDGDLEITWINDPNADINFLQHIREVTGFVLIARVSVRRLVMPSLQIIRGRTLFHLNGMNERFSLLVMYSHIETLAAPSLRDILDGNVGLVKNTGLCHIASVRWADILSDSATTAISLQNSVDPACSRCHPACSKDAGCWGPDADQCQNLSKLNCSPQCHGGRCFGPAPRQCCHLFCAGGCTGPTQSQCLACRNFFDNGVCKQECPSMRRYNQTAYSWQHNPDGKFAYGATCVPQCPPHLLRDSSACVRSCPAHKRAVSGECRTCNGSCERTCRLAEGEVLHADNVESLRNCSSLHGSLVILEHTFNGFHEFVDNKPGPFHGPMHPSRLEALSSLQEISGFVRVEASNVDFLDLGFLRNLRFISGRVRSDSMALYVVKTSLRSLGLLALRSIRFGSVAITKNPRLCMADSVDWRHLVARRPNSNETFPVAVYDNRPRRQCVAEGLVCHSECTDEGCWGPQDSQCVRCRHFRLDSSCVRSCRHTSGVYQSSNSTCSRCDVQCATGCVGDGPARCRRCRHYRDGSTCVARCPPGKYDHSAPGGAVCKRCHENCARACSGPHNVLGRGGCNSCRRALLDEVKNQTICLGANETCPEGHFFEFSAIPAGNYDAAATILTGVCRKCHHLCRKCSGFGFHVSVCSECKYYHSGEQCVLSCPENFFVNSTSRQCVACHHQCQGCTGAGQQCLTCRNFKLTHDPISANISSSASTSNASSLSSPATFECVSECPASHPHRILAGSGDGRLCAAASGRMPPLSQRHGDNNDGSGKFSDAFTAVCVGTAIILALAIVSAALVCRCLNWRKRRHLLRLAELMSKDALNEPLRPTDVRPNLAKLRVVQEGELRRAGILGYGAFGTVYRGVWAPSDASNNNGRVGGGGGSVKIPVAIKVLREGSACDSNNDILHEAYIMATLDHVNLLPLLAVCMTSRMMLITQLMPLGCLRDYVSANRRHIGSQSLLNWCAQIARGMAYLERQRLVHRDLAARNVLLQTPALVKITDFGLAKLLDIDESQYKAASGRMPLKWLALECIQQRVFTHKSDVWAFGVTVWELLTYGGRPYENIAAADVPALLEKGERLPQPACCSIEVYMLMVKCWVLEADARPGFAELLRQFCKMARDPGRYLQIAGDALMKLPSFSPQDEQALVRHLAASALDNPASDIVVMASEYLATPQHTTENNDQGAIYRSAAAENTNTNAPNHETPATNDVWPKTNGAVIDAALDDQQYLLPSPSHLSAHNNFSSLTPSLGMTEVANPEYMTSLMTSHIEGSRSAPSSLVAPTLLAAADKKQNNTTDKCAIYTEAANSVGVPLKMAPPPRQSRISAAAVSYYNCLPPEGAPVEPCQRQNTASLTSAVDGETTV